MNDSEKKIQGYLKNPSPKDRDEFLQLVAGELQKMRSDLIRYVDSFNTDLTDSENLIGDVIMKCIDKLEKQFNEACIQKRQLNSPIQTKKQSMIFDPERGPPLKGYAIVIIGKPYPNSKKDAGMFANALRDQRKEIIDENEDLKDDFTLGQSDYDRFEISEMGSVVEDVLAQQTEARDAFIFRLATGMHGYSRVTPAIVMSMAMDSDFNRSEVKDMGTALEEDCRTDSARTLTHKTLAKITKLSPSGVRYTLSKVKAQIKDTLEAVGYDNHYNLRSSP